MQQATLIVGDDQGWLQAWPGPVSGFDGITPGILAGFRRVVLAPETVLSQKFCHHVLGWKRDGLLDNTRLILGTYKGRHLWSPENDRLVELWVVHARSEWQVLESQRLAFIPLCLPPPLPEVECGDDGYLFMGGRKWRAFDVGVAAMSRSGHPGRMISDFAPEGDFPGVEIRREKIPKDEYMAVMARARLVLVPLARAPISHGHTDVIAAILLGRPVLVTAGCSCDDYVQHGVNGLLVPDNSIEAWTDAIHEAYERADEFAAKARALAPSYHLDRYARYLQEVLAHPDRHLIVPDLERSKPLLPRSEWEHMRQEDFLRERKQKDREILQEARNFLRNRQFQAGLAELEKCLDGPFRDTARRLKKTALMRMDPAGAEAFLRGLIEQEGHSAELATDLAGCLFAQKRFEEALFEAQRAVDMAPERRESHLRLEAIRRHIETRRRPGAMRDGAATGPGRTGTCSDIPEPGEGQNQEKIAPRLAPR